MSQMIPPEKLTEIAAKPESNQLKEPGLKIVKKEQESFPNNEKKSIAWQRLVKGTFFITLGGVAAIIGITTVKTRVTHLIVDTGLINGRIVRLQTPIDGEIRNMYARPGAKVPAGQVLARIGYNPQEAQTLLQLTGEVRSNEIQLDAARRSLALLQDQLQDLNHQSQAYWHTNQARADGSVDIQRAALDSAMSRVRAARSEYESNAQLLSEGIVAKLQVEKLYAAWKEAEASARQGQATLQNAQTTQTAAQRGILDADLAGNLLNLRSRLAENIQTQSTLVSTLQTQLENNRQRLQQSKTLFGDRRALAITAPFSGLVYRIEHERGEQVSRTQSLITLLDCNNLWVEAVVNAADAASINRNAPVMVQMEGYTQPIRGELDLIQPISSVQNIDEQARLMEAQALPPTIPMNLMGQPLVRLTVKIPPPPQYNQSKQFCGVGQVTQLSFQRRYPWGMHS